MLISDIIQRHYTSFGLYLEKGPWNDDGSGEVSLVEVSLGCSVDTFNRFVEINNSISVAQEEANRQGRKVVLTIEGEHKDLGEHRQEVGVFYPQIKAEFQVPVRVGLERRVLPQFLRGEGATLEEAENNLKEAALHTATVVYYWDNDLQTQGQLPTAPPGFELFIVQLRADKRNIPRPILGEYFLAVKNGKRPAGINMSVSVGRQLITISEDGCEANLLVPSDSYILSGDWWTVVVREHWWMVVK